ncbi:MAG: hypothetical protein F3740_08080 [Nitrospinae bacterium]|nr:hypothetical protein [Nitrospinota bacterium]
MTFLNRRKLNNRRSKWSAMVLVVGFALITVFGSPIHDHDLDSSHVDLDCISCHLVHSSVGLEHDDPDIFAKTQETQPISISTNLQISSSISSVFSRAPPITC